jgi:hypothetical protein
MDELCNRLDAHVPVLDGEYETARLFYSRDKTIKQLVESDDYLKVCHSRFKRYYKYIAFENQEIYSMIDDFFNCESDDKGLLAQKAKNIDVYVIKEMEYY